MAKTQKTPILIINEENFSDIMSGKKKEEYRSLSEHYFKMFWNKNKQGIYDEKKKIDKIILAVGYRKDRKVAVVEVKGIFIDKFLNFIPEGMQKGDECFTIELGEVLETNFNTSEYGRNSSSKVRK
jgi:hypothetical protein